MNKILKIVNLKKNFGAITASNDINFCLETGEIHALIGPNGAGKIVKSNPGSDPASVAFKAMEFAQNQSIDQVIVDTAGRLQNKKNLMDELKKIGNVIKKNDDTAPHEVILVLDATSGQNIINQLEEFNKLLPVTGIIMTKLDGTAKGGILIAISKKYKVPIVGLGLGEKEDDLQIFEAEKFANAFTQIN